MTQAPSASTSPVAGASPKKPLNDEVVVRCAGLSKTFKDFWLRNRVRAVDNIDLDIRRGEVFGLLGPNGSGKSTTIKMILGLLHPTAGRISVFGKRPEDVSTKKLIGYLPEESYLYRFLNARETLEYYGKLFHQSRHQSQKRIDMLLEMVGLESAQRRPVGEFSKGMQRRIGLAQALINDPQLLILDEPTTGLDPIGTRQIKDLIVELANRGKTILLCSHLLSDVEDVCDRVSIMFGGKVQRQGTCDQLLVQQNATTIQTASLDDKVIQEIEEVLARHGKSIDRVDHPRQRLEQLFLEIVQKAQSEGATTSGARAGGKIAGFLVDEDGKPTKAAEDVQAEELVQQLVTGAKPAASKPAGDAAGKSAATTPSTPSGEPAAAAASAEQASKEASKQQQSVLDSLVNPKPAASATSPSAASSTSSPASKSEQPGSGPAASPKAPAVNPTANVDQSLISELVGQKTAATPERAEPAAAKTPSADSKAQASEAPEAPKAQTPAKAPDKAPEQTSDKSSDSSSTADKGEHGDQERPDTSFLDAMKQVPPYDESKDGKKNNPKPNDHA